MNSCRTVRRHSDLWHFRQPERRDCKGVQTEIFARSPRHATPVVTFMLGASNPELARQRVSAMLSHPPYTPDFFTSHTRLRAFGTSDSIPSSFLSCRVFLFITSLVRIVCFVFAWGCKGVKLWWTFLIYSFSWLIVWPSQTLDNKCKYIPVLN